LTYNVIGNHGLSRIMIVIIRFIFKTEIKRIINHSKVPIIIVLLSRVFSGTPAGDRPLKVTHIIAHIHIGTTFYNIIYHAQYPVNNNDYC